MRLRRTLPNPLPPKGRNLQPTLKRQYHGDDHMPPARGMTDNEGSLWKGASRIVNRAAKRKHNRDTWRKILAEARREHLALRRAAEAADSAD